MSVWGKLAGSLFRMVFGWYLLLAVVVTGVQLGLEFSETRRAVGQDLESIGRSFAPTLADTLWTFDRPQLETVAKGLVTTASVTGVQIESTSGRVVVRAGEVPEVKADGAHGGLLAPFQLRRIPLRMTAPLGDERTVGQVTLFSDRRVVVRRVAYSFVIILTNSLIKAAGLWLIFQLVITRGLSRPLAQVTEIVSRVEFAARSREPVPLEYPNDDELGRLIKAMTTMQARLAAAHDRLDQANRDLEATVVERTNHLSEVVALSETILLESPVPMAVYDGEGSCVKVNQAYAALVGETREQVLEQNLMQLPFWQRTGLRAVCLTALTEQRPQRCDVHATTSAGAVWVHCRILPTVLGGRRHLLIQCVDRTERERNGEAPPGRTA